MSIAFDPRAVVDPALRLDLEKRIDVLFNRFSVELGLPVYTLGDPAAGDIVLDTLKMRGYSVVGSHFMVGAETPQRVAALNAAAMKALADLQSDNSATFVVTAKDAADLQRLQGLGAAATTALGVS